MTPRSRRRTLGAAVASLLLAGPLAAPNVALAADPLTIRMGEISGTLAFLPHEVAKGLGLFDKLQKERGIKLELTVFTNGPDETRSLTVGQLDAASSMFLESAVPMALGEPLTNVLVYNNAGTTSMVVSAKFKAASLPALIQELGRPVKVGVTALGAGSDLLARSFLDAAGVPTKDYQIVVAGGVNAYFPALAQGRVDIIQAGEPVAQKLVDQGLGRFIVDGWNRDAVLKLFGSDFQVNGLNVRNELIEKNPEAVQAIVDVMLEGMRFIRDNAARPEAIIGVLPKPFQDMMREVDAATVIRRVSAGISPDGCPSDSAARTVQKSLEAATLLKPKAVDWSKYQTARFLHGACR